MRIVEQCFTQLPAGPHTLSDEILLEAGVMADSGKRGDTDALWKTRAKTCGTLEGAGRAEHAGVVATAPAFTLPPKEEAYGNIEGLMRHFEIIMWGKGIQPPRGETYLAVEGGNGELGFHVVSDGTDRPYRVRCRPPCFFIMAALAKLLIGSTIADIVPTFGSVNMIAGELDR